MQRVGVFDSGLGGLSVWRELRRALPGIDTIYVADQAHIPYGPRTPETILGYSRGIVSFLVEEGCETIVVACNTASAAALQPLRADWPDKTFIGMEPAIKPAVQASRSGVVVVLATATTLEGTLFQQTVQRVAQGVRVLRQPCPGLVEQIERGETDTPATREMLRVFLEQPRLAGADVCVLGCTHYAFARAALEELVGDSMHILDPAPAIARRLHSLLGDEVPTADSVQHLLYTTGDVTAFDRVASSLLGYSVQGHPLTWNADRLQRH